VALITPCLGNDQAKIRVDHPILGGEVAALDPLGQLGLFARSEQRMRARAPQEQFKRILKSSRLIVGRLRPRCRSRRGMRRPSRILSIGLGRSLVRASRASPLCCLLMLAPRVAGAGTTLGFKAVQVLLRYSRVR
jgi:hypothetical protein